MSAVEASTLATSNSQDDSGHVHVFSGIVCSQGRLVFCLVVATFVWTRMHRNFVMILDVMLTLGGS